MCLVVFVAAGLTYFALNTALTASAISLRENRPFRAIYVANLKQFGVSMAGLTPVAWLMAAMYVFAGPIGVLPFALPLYTTRVGYKKIVEIRDMFTQTVKSLASAVDAKDPYTAGHSVRVQIIAKELGAELGVSEDDLEALEWGGLLHDIGKIGVPDAVLLKQGDLTRDERITMNAHPVKGEEIIRPVAKLAPELPVIRHHHEWYNGSWLPRRPAGRGHPVAGAHPARGRLVRGDDRRPTLPHEAADRRECARRAAQVERHPVRSQGGRRLRAAGRAKARLVAQGDAARRVRAAAAEGAGPARDRSTAGIAPAKVTAR